MRRSSKLQSATAIGLAVVFVAITVLHAVAVAVRESGTDLPIWPRAGPYTLIVTFGYVLHSVWFLRPASKTAVVCRLLMSALAVPYAAMSVVLVCKFYLGAEELRQVARSKAFAERLYLEKENRRLLDDQTRRVVELKSKLDDERRTQDRQKLELAISEAELELQTLLPEAPWLGIDTTSELAKRWGTTPRRYVLYDALATGAILVVSPYLLLTFAAWMWPRPLELQAHQSSAKQTAKRMERQRAQPEFASSASDIPERSTPTEKSIGVSASARAAGSTATRSPRKRQSRQVQEVTSDGHRKACEKHGKMKTSSRSGSQPRRKRLVTTAHGPDDLQPASRHSTRSRNETLCVIVAERELDCECPRICRLARSRKTQTFNVTVKRSASWICTVGIAGLDCMGYWSRGPPILCFLEDHNQHIG